MNPALFFYYRSFLTIVSFKYSIFSLHVISKRILSTNHEIENSILTSLANFKKINEAYQTLIDENDRRAYDQFLDAGGQEGFDTYNNDSYVDVTTLDEFMHHHLSPHQLKDFLKQHSDEQILHFYEYF